jgi:hypothetical protein
LEYEEIILEKMDLAIDHCQLIPEREWSDYASPATRQLRAVLLAQDRPIAAELTSRTHFTTKQFALQSRDPLP